MNQELKDLLTSNQVQHLEKSKNMPLDTAFWMRSYFQQQLMAGSMTDSQAVEANAMVSNLLEGLGGCERIITTPIPIAYRINLKRLILIYCVGLPFRLVPKLGWWALPTVAVVSFLLLGVKEVGRELENPFGTEVNDLPLDDICKTVSINIDSTLAMGA